MLAVLAKPHRIKSAHRRRRRSASVRQRYNYFRDYDPTTGRYVESDPIGLAGGYGTYVYSANNPLREIDASGLAGTIVLNPPQSPSIPSPGILVEVCVANPLACAAIAIGCAIPNSTASSCQDEPNPPPEYNCKKDEPCDPPEGTKCYEGPDYGKPHGGLSPHYHIFEMQKKRSKDGECFWRYLGGKIGVGVLEKPPPEMKPCSSYPNFTGRGG